MAPQMLFGAVFATALAVAAPGALPWAIPTLAGCLLAVPFTCGTAAPRFGAWMRRYRLCAVPDDLAPAPVLARIGAPAPEILRPAFAEIAPGAMVRPGYEHGAD
jgi:membrane glycosyltransferase